MFNSIRLPTQAKTLIHAVVICLLSIAQVHAGIFERIYKLPNAQTITAENNYQPLKINFGFAT